MVIVLLACRSSDGPPDFVGTDTRDTAPTTGATTATTGATGATGGTGDTGPLVPLLAEALADRCPDPTPPPPYPAGDALHRATVLGSDASCNDGTPPVLYVRAATDPAHAADWVLHFEGGSFCEDYETCAARWCGEDFYDASKMSSAWAPESRDANGILSTDPSNAFSGYNHAYFPYCSSDFWVGTRDDHVFDGDPPYRLHFEGHEIALAGLDALSAGVVSDDGAEALASIDLAATVLVTGSSAGGYAAAAHTQVVADRLPGASVVGVPDAIFYPAPEVLTPSEIAAMTAEIDALYAATFVALWDGWTAEACAADHVADPAVCSNVDTILRQYTTAPFVWHVDLYDPVLYPYLAGFLYTKERFAEVVSATLSTYAGGVPAASLHGSACTAHVTLTGDRSFDGIVVDDAAGTPWSLHDALEAHVGGARVVAIDDPSGAASTCPGP